MFSLLENNVKCGIIVYFDIIVCVVYKIKLGYKLGIPYKKKTYIKVMLTTCNLHFSTSKYWFNYLAYKIYEKRNDLRKSALCIYVISYYNQL